MADSEILDDEIVESDPAETDPTEKALLDTAMRRFKIAEEAEAEIRKDALDDLKFSIGEQWPDEIKIARDQDRRPCLTVNLLPQYIHQITNDQRQNRQAGKISPTDNAATKEVAEIYQGMVRHIENASNADTAYDTAGDSAARCGFGYWRLVTEYCDPLSFDQEIRVKRVRNRFSVYLDPSHQELDGSDSNWGFVFEAMLKDDYKREYPGSKLSRMDSWTGLGDEGDNWITKDGCRVAEYFYKEYRPGTLVQVKTQDKIVAMEEDQVPPALHEDIVRDADGEPVRRKTQIPKICWVKHNGMEILKKTVLPGSGKWIPIIPVYGDEVDVDGRVVREGVVRHAKDSQRAYNFWKSAQAETIALAPRAPWIGVEGQFEGHEKKWATANTRSHAYIEYAPVSLDGTPAPPPQRTIQEPPIQALSAVSAQAAQDLKSTTGIYDATLGANAQEISGKAIERRTHQSQTSNFHFMDNLSKSMRQSTRIMVDWIPDVYDTARAVRILHPDGSDEVVMINQQFEHNGKPAHYDLAAGTYDVVIGSGPSFETKRQESVQAIGDLFGKLPPQLVQSIADIYIDNMDWPGADKIAERLRKLLPPALQDDKKNQQIPPQAQAMLSQLQQQNQALVQHLNAATDEIKTKKFELESKERIAMAGLQADIAIEHARLRAKGADKVLDAEMENIDRFLTQNQLSQMQTDSQTQTQNGQPGGAPGASPGGPNVQPPNGGASPANSMGAP